MTVLSTSKQTASQNYLNKLEIKIDMHFLRIIKLKKMYL